MREMMVPPRLPFTPEGRVQLVITRAAADLLTPPMQDLYGTLVVAELRGGAARLC